MFAFPTIFLTPNKTMLSFVNIWKEIYILVSYTVMLEVNGTFFFFLNKST